MCAETVSISCYVLLNSFISVFRLVEAISHTMNASATQAADRPTANKKSYDFYFIFCSFENAIEDRVKNTQAKHVKVTLAQIHKCNQGHHNINIHFYMNSVCRCLSRWCFFSSVERMSQKLWRYLTLKLSVCDSQLNRFCVLLSSSSVLYVVVVCSCFVPSSFVQILYDEQTQIFWSIRVARVSRAFARLITNR